MQASAKKIPGSRIQRMLLSVPCSCEATCLLHKDGAWPLRTSHPKSRSVSAFHASHPGIRVCLSCFIPREFASIQDLIRRTLKYFLNFQLRKPKPLTSAYSIAPIQNLVRRPENRAILLGGYHILITITVNDGAPLLEPSKQKTKCHDVR